MINVAVSPVLHVEGCQTLLVSVVVHHHLSCSQVATSLWLSSCSLYFVSSLFCSFLWCVNLVFSSLSVLFAGGFAWIHLVLNHELKFLLLQMAGGPLIVHVLRTQGRISSGDCRYSVRLRIWFGWVCVYFTVSKQDGGGVNLPQRVRGRGSLLWHKFYMVWLYARPSQWGGGGIRSNDLLPVVAGLKEKGGGIGTLWSRDRKIPNLWVEMDLHKPSRLFLFNQVQYFLETILFSCSLRYLVMRRSRTPWTCSWVSSDLRPAGRPSGRRSTTQTTTSITRSNLGDPWHLGTDPDSDPRIHTFD